jgi:UDP-N-acetyl-D-mannosaminuronic acid dehydrogenase
MADEAPIRNAGDVRVCIIGLGYVGLTLAVALARAGLKVIGIERNRAVASIIASGRAHFSEEGLDEHLGAAVANGSLTVHDAIPDDLDASVHIVTVGTPVNDRHKVRIAPLQNALGEVRRALKGGELIVLRSTVGVGTCRNVVKPILDSAGLPYDLAFCPERTIEGKALEELTTLPQVVGGLTPEATRRADAFFRRIAAETILVSSIESAEMVKLINNTYRDVTFAFANEMAAAAEAAGISAAEVLNAANRNYPRGSGMPGPVGGPCLEKDPYILAEAFAEFGFTPEISLSARRFNESLPERVVQRLAALAGDVSRIEKVAVLGLAFKGEPATSDLRGSLAIPLVEQLRKAFLRATVVGYDPLVDRREAAANDIVTTESIAEAVGGADLVVIQSNHADFRALEPESAFAGMRPGGFIYDLWGLYGAAPRKLPGGLGYTALGATFRDGG